MQRFIQLFCYSTLMTILVAGTTLAQSPLTWQEVRNKFEAANPSLQAGQIGIAESRAEETTAHLRPNPNLSVSVDQINLFTSQTPPSGGPNA